MERNTKSKELSNTEFTSVSSDVTTTNFSEITETAELDLHNDITDICDMEYYGELQDMTLSLVSCCVFKLRNSILLIQIMKAFNFVDK